MPRPRALLPALPMAMLLAVDCAVPQPSPPGEPEVLLATEDEDRQQGAKEAERVAAELGLVEAPELVDYLERLGRRLVSHARRRRFDYSFAIVDQDAPNAFAVPGGFVFVSRGLLALTNSEHELANVIAHEVVHVSARHAAGRQRAAATAVNPLMLPGVLVGAVLGEAVGGALLAPFQALNLGYIARYTREQEREADRLGQELAAKAGFDPDGMVSFLRSLENSERLRAAASRLPRFLDTHPATPHRVAEAGSRTRHLHWVPRPGIARSRADYLRRIDGLVLGTSPREGVFQGDRFLHPDLDFTLRFPEGWKLVNTPRALVAISPRRDAELFLELQGKGSDPESAAGEFLSKIPPELSFEVTQRESRRIGGLPAHRISGRTRSSGGPIRVEITWIAHDGWIYRLTARVPAGPSHLYRGALRNVARSFRPLTPAERNSIRVTRLRVARARPGESLDALGRRTGNVWNLQQTAVMNGLFAGAAIAPGRPVKIAVAEAYRTPAVEEDPPGPGP